MKGITTVATVTFDNATRIYPGTTKPAVDKLNIEIADGEFLVLVGPSGCGKSTSLRMLAGLEDVNAGRILIGDRDVTDVPPKDRDIVLCGSWHEREPRISSGHQRDLEASADESDVFRSPANGSRSGTCDCLRRAGCRAVGRIC